MNNAAQIDLHTASVMLKNKIIESHYFNMLDCRNFIKIKNFNNDLPENKRRSRADARIVPRDCRPILLGPTLRWADFTIYLSISIDSVLPTLVPIVPHWPTVSHSHHPHPQLGYPVVPLCSTGSYGIVFTQAPIDRLLTCCSLLDFTVTFFRVSVMCCHDLYFNMNVLFIYFNNSKALLFWDKNRKFRLLILIT